MNRPAHPSRPDADRANAGRPFWRRDDFWYVAMILLIFAASVALLLVAHVVLPIALPDLK